ncbi:MAG: DUF1990 domain-containing protein [Acidobacteriota bacterium]
MFLLTQPTKKQVREFLDAQASSGFSYAEVGASRHGSPIGYNSDHNRIQLGTGADAFALAVQAIQRWQMFNTGWVKLYFSDAPIAVGACVAPLASHLGFYSLNACRIVYVIDENDNDVNVKKYGFAYGTLTEHVEQGEERFSVEWHHADNSVWYDLFAFSKPRHPFARLAYPVSRQLQKRFAADSQQAMLRAVKFEEL